MKSCAICGHIESDVERGTCPMCGEASWTLSPALASIVEAAAENPPVTIVHPELPTAEESTPDADVEADAEAPPSAETPKPKRGRR